MAFTKHDLVKVADDVNKALDDVMGEGKGNRFAVQSRNGYSAVDLYGRDAKGHYGCIRTVETGKPNACAWVMHAEAFWMMIDHTRMTKRKRKGT